MMNSWKSGHQLLAVMLLVFLFWVALFFPTIVATIAIWERSETFTHCFLILPICIYVIRRDWPLLSSLPIVPNFWALIAVLGALTLWLLGKLSYVAAVEQFAAFALLPLFYWLVLGNRVCKSMLFVLLFWMFSVPEGEFLIPKLQEITADITVFALRLTDIPVFRDGLYIAVPGGLFEVAVACSGIRYLIASFSLGTLFAYLTYSKWHKRLIFIIFSLLLPILANGIRAYGIVMIAYLSEMKHAVGVDHLIYGWVFFGVVIFMMFSIGNIWRDPDKTAVVAEQVSLTAATNRNIVGALVMVGIMSAGTFLYAGYASKTTPQEAPNLSPFLPAESAVLGDKSWFPKFHNASAEYAGKSEIGAVFIAYYDTSEEGKELISSQNSLYDPQRWSVVSRDVGPDFLLLEITNTIGQRRFLAQTYVTQWIQTPKALNLKLSQALQSLLGQTQSGLAVVLSTTVANAREEAEFKQHAERFFKQDFREWLNE